MEVLDRRGRPRVQTVFEDESLTDQSQYELTRIDKIMERFGVTGLMDHLSDVDEMFLDVSELPQDYQDVLQYAAEAEQEFMKLDPRVRAVFGNDAALWLDAAHDQEKRDAIAAAAPAILAKYGVSTESTGGVETDAEVTPGGEVTEGA